MSDTELATLHHQLRRLRGELQADLEAVSILRGVATRRDEIDRLTNDLDHQLERLPRAAVVTLVGATGAGKSALLNALVGDAVALEGIDRPTTRRTVVYAPRDADLTTLLEAAPGAAPPLVVRYDAVSRGPWTTQVLVDAPDLNSVATEHRATVTALAERSDVLLIVLHRQSVVEHASASFLDAFTRRRHLIFVLNRADELTDAARDELLQQIRELAATRWHAPEAPVLSVSARAAQQQPRSPGWAELCATLHDLVRESTIAGVRRLNALGTAARIGEIFAPVEREAGSDLRALTDDVSNGLAALAVRAGDEAAARLRLRRPDIAALLLAEASKRWDGPGGWALRAGGLGGLGFGAGALLARRHPLVAGGAAAGSLAVDQARQVAQRQRLVEADGLLPGRAEFELWYTDALSPARVRAARLAGDAAALGVPLAEDLRAESVAAVEDSWNTFIDRDLPAAAEHSMLRFFRVPLDLPVYGLGGWVVYRVGRGFVTGEYAGTDFLVNALLLLAAYLFAVAFVVRRGLGLRARALLRQVTDRGRAAVGTLGEAVRQSVANATSAQLAALQRLGTLGRTWRDRCGMIDR